MKFDFRNAWVQVHLWLGLTLGMLGILIGLTGSVLVYDQEIDALLNPQRYAVSGREVALKPSEYLAKATEAAAGRARPVNLRLPDEPGMPVVVLARGGAPGERPTLMRIYLDPPTGKVLDSGNGGFVAWAHNFHESLTLRQVNGQGINGRGIVGAVGIAMLISSLSGIYLWWPGRKRLTMGLTTRRGFTTSRNIHYLVGFYGSLMLAMLSFTGMYLAYPEFGRDSTEKFALLSPTQRNIQTPEPAPRTETKPDGATAEPGKEAAKAEGEKGARRHQGESAMRMGREGDADKPGTEAKGSEAKATGETKGSATAAAGDAAKTDAPKGEGRRGGGRRNREGGAGGAPRIPVEQAIRIAQGLYPDAHVLGVGLPAGPRGVYRIGMNLPGTALNSPGGSMVAYLNPADGSVIRRVDPASSTAGDRYLAIMRPLHSAEGLGAFWKVLYFLGGLLPAFLAITGTMMWLRGRRLKKSRPAVVRVSAQGSAAPAP
ncbi:MAG TPA: PepSY domain-containing protein [Burkholderiales bacterium]